MKRYKGKNVLVTGGRSGIGRAITLRLQAEGAQVITAQRATDQNCNSIIADFEDPEGPAAVTEEAIHRMGGLDLLVNNAGMMQEAYAEEMSLADWNKTIQVNLTAPFLMIKAALKHLRTRKGAIVNIGSVEGLGSNPMHAAYGASKAGLHGLTHAIAVDHGAEGIRCNAVAPGWIDTELNTDFIENMPNPGAFRDGLAAIHPIGRTGTPEDVANLVAFLGSDDASFITGQIYKIDGGRMSKLSLPLTPS